MALISRAVYSWGICLAIEAKTIPFLSRITTPTPDLFCFLKVAPSQLIFTKSRWGGRHLVWGGLVETRESRGVVQVCANSTIRSFAVAAIWWELTAALFRRSRFLWVQISQAVVQKKERSRWLMMSHERSSLKSTKVWFLLHCHCASFSQTTSNSRQDYIACRADSGACLQWSQVEQSMTIRRTKLSLVGKEFRQALHIRFFIFFGTEAN